MGSAEATRGTVPRTSWTPPPDGRHEPHLGTDATVQAGCKSKVRPHNHSAQAGSGNG